MKTFTKVILGITLPIAFVIFVVSFMFIFRLCPPIESGPQPPWCVNEERFDTDLAAIDNLLTATKKELLEDEFLPESIYVPGTVDYLDYDLVEKDYTTRMGIGPADFFWVVCNDEKECVDPYHSLISTFSRAESLGTDFMYISDFASIDGDLNIYSGSTEISSSEVKKIKEVAEEYDQDLIVTINMYLDDNTLRHTEAGDDKGRMGETQMIALFDSGMPSKEKAMKAFAEWEELLPKYLEKWNGIDYISITPTDHKFDFHSETELLNGWMKDLIMASKEQFDGKVCVSVDIPYLKKVDLDYYLEADCIVILFDDSIDVFEGAEENVDALKAKYDEYFSHSVFNSDKEIFAMVVSMSYDGVINGGWFEVGDYKRLGKYVVEDQKEQATIFEAFFRSLYENEVPVTGIFAYQYAWDDEKYPETFLRQDWGPSIRGKDAEHVFYKWSQILKN